MNRYRLHDPNFNYEREEPEETIKPATVFFISAEGTRSETEYFTGIRQMLHESPQSGKKLLVLKRFSKSGESSVNHVLSIAEECEELRNSETADKLPESVIKVIDDDDLPTYLNDKSKLPKKRCKEIENKLFQCGIDLDYRRFLRDYGVSASGESIDRFCVVIDRDSKTHSLKQMKDCIEYCRAKGYECYISNPCFDFWLLLHVCDVKVEFKNQLDLIKENAKVSSSHTYVSREVSRRCHHNKKGIGFDKNYRNHIQVAIRNAQKFTSNLDELISQIGTNVWKLTEDILYK